MKTDKLSAFVDGELFGAEKQAAAQELEQHEALATAALYYRIGDELRAESAKAELSAEFAQRLAASLEAEPPLSVPVAVQAGTEQDRSESAARVEMPITSDDPDKPVRAQKQFAVPGLVA